MASSDHLIDSLIDPWIPRPASFLDPWFANAFSSDTDTLTRALRVTLSSPSPSPDSNSNTTNTASSDTSLAPDVVSSFLIPTPGLNTAYFGSGSGSFEIENVLHEEETVRRAEALASKKKQRNGGVASGKVVKRNPRATKGLPTTFIMADPASFRQMVQQVTGSSRLGYNPAINTRQIKRPEARRPGGDLSRNNGSSSSSLGAAASIADCLPTLDTSALLLDRHRTQDQQHAAEMVGQGSVDAVTAITDDLEPFGSFPTLDSWNSL